MVGTDVFSQGMVCLSLAGAALAGGYGALYLAFRLGGTLQVNAGGWHAGHVEAGGRVFVPAVRVLGLFQPLLRCESALARRLGSPPREQAVSEVVVELVPIT